jgi:ABC-type amino acid transport substrate-binding protein
MRRVTSLVLIGLVILLSGCTENNESELVVGLECNYAPFNWTTSAQGESGINIDQVSAYCDGYDVTMSTYLADELGMELVIRKIEWDGLIPALLSGEIDVIIAGMSPTPQRAETVSFTNEYFRSEQVLVVSTNSIYASASTLNDFDGAGVIAQMSTLQDGLIDQISGVNHQTALGDYPSLVASLISGVSDALVAELPVAQSIVASNTGLTIIRLGNEGFTVDESDVSVSVAVRQDENKLLDSINAVLNGISEETRNQWMTDALTRQP